MSKAPLIVDLPYPSLDDITPNLRQAEIISPAYSAPKSELTAVLQYTYQHLFFNKYQMNEIANVVEEISIAEMTHFELLGEVLIKLGINPIMVENPPIKRNYFSTSNVDFSTSPRQMLLASIEGEIEAINTYSEMIIQLLDAPVAELIRRIKMDEELHLATLKQLYVKLSNG